MPSRKIIQCVDCGRFALNKGYNRCSTCYTRMYKTEHPDARYARHTAAGAAATAALTRPRKRIAKCERCSIYIGPGYIFEIPHALSGHTYCSWCYEELLLNQYKRAA